MAGRNEDDAKWTHDTMVRLKPTMAAVVAAIRDRRMRAAKGMIATHPPTLEEVAEIALTAAVLAVGNYRVEADEEMRLRDAVAAAEQEVGR